MNIDDEDLGAVPLTQVEISDPYYSSNDIIYYRGYLGDGLGEIDEESSPHPEPMHESPWDQQVQSANA